MSSSILNRQQLGNPSRAPLVVIMLVLAILLSSCGGGLFGTSDSSNNSDNADAVASPGPEAPAVDAPDPDNTVPDATPGVMPEPPTQNETQDQPLVFDFSNTTPSGLASASSVLPALKLINLTEAGITVSTADQAINIASQDTSELLGVNTGETLVNVSTQDSGRSLANITPLNAAADTLTTLVIEPTDPEANSNEQALSVSLLALDTRVVATVASMADIRVVSTERASADSLQPNFILTPTESSAAGAELVLSNADENTPGVGIYALANAGSYLLSSSDSSFSPVPITLLANAVHTIIITGNPQLPVYVEVDSFSE